MENKKRLFKTFR